MNKYNNHVLSKIKAFAIILMVIGHTDCNRLLHDTMYLFHMPCFFLCSGYFFKCAENNTDLINMLGRKIKRLYIPYLKYGLLMVAFHNVFSFLYLYDNRIIDGVEFKKHYEICDYLYNFGRTLIMRTSEPFLGGYWFIRDLFLSTILMLFLKRIFHYWKFVYLILIPFCVYAVSCNLAIPIVGNVTGLLEATLFIGLGMFWKEKENIFPVDIRVSFIILIVLVITAYICKHEISISRVTVSEMPILLISGLLGFYMLYIIGSKLSNNMINNFLVYIGNNTLLILTFHLVAFKVVSSAYVFFTKSDLSLLASLPTILNLSNCWIIIYSIFGVLLPLLVPLSLKKIQSFKHFL